MIQIGKTLVSEEIIEKHFVCNIAACKGECCIAGDSGAPLEEQELQIMNDIYPSVKPFMRKEGIKAVEEQGTYIMNDDKEFETPLIDNAACAYVIYNEGNTALCAIEEAYNQDKITWKKPISCHLYPIRVRDYSDFSGVNYDRWDICNTACSLGKELQVPIYTFVKEALIRKFGLEWYTELENIANNIDLMR